MSAENPYNNYGDFGETPEPGDSDYTDNAEAASESFRLDLWVTDHDNAIGSVGRQLDQLWDLPLDARIDEISGLINDYVDMHHEELVGASTYHTFMGEIGYANALPEEWEQLREDAQIYTGDTVTRLWPVESMLIRLVGYRDDWLMTQLEENAVHYLPEPRQGN